MTATRSTSRAVRLNSIPWAGIGIGSFVLLCSGLMISATFRNRGAIDVQPAAQAAPTPTPAPVVMPSPVVVPTPAPEPTPQAIAATDINPPSYRLVPQGWEKVLVGDGINCQGSTEDAGVLKCDRIVQQVQQ